MKFVFVSGRRLMELREEKGLIQEDIALGVGVSRQTVITWEGKDMNKMKFENAQKLARLLGKSVKDLTNDKTNYSDVKDIIENENYIGMHRRVYDALEKNMDTHRKVMLEMSETIKNLTGGRGGNQEGKQVSRPQE